MNTTLALLVKYNGTFAENAKMAGVVTLLGMAAIFTVLALLWGAIELLHQGLNLPARRRAKKEAAVLPEKIPAEAVAAPAEPSSTDDGAIVAAITAAITAARAEEGTTTGFRVVSFRRAAR